MLKKVILILLCALIAYQVVKYRRWRKCRPRFEGKTVFISGGSSGIGECLCKLFIKLGASHVYIAARRLHELERVKKESGDPERVTAI
jgi:NADPH:quinone reductase-like Zn-dependent oxidoreductase